EVAAGAEGDRHRVERDHLAAVPELAERREPRRETEGRVEPDEVVLVEGQGTTERSVARVAEGNHGRQPVEAATEEDEYEAARLSDVGEAHDGKAESGDATEAHVLQELSSFHHHLHWKAGLAITVASRSAGEIDPSATT